MLPIVGEKLFSTEISLRFRLPTAVRETNALGSDTQIPSTAGGCGERLINKNVIDKWLARPRNVPIDEATKKW